MIITEDQRKRAVGLNIKLWKDTNGQIHIPYIIDSGSKFSQNKQNIFVFLYSRKQFMGPRFLKELYSRGS